MQTTVSISELRGAVRQWRAEGASIALVPTMGNLHDGHMQLVARAKTLGERVVVSIFVNPMQFNDRDDFANYPQTLDEDTARLAEAGVDVLFIPGVQAIYPRDIAAMTRVEVPGISDILCGEYRPGHFAGVCTVVAKLFNIVQPDIAVFGEKDYQQLLVIRRMSADLSFPVHIDSVATVREQDGLAMSSRNRYLDDSERLRAGLLYKTLCQARDRILGGETDYRRIETAAFEALAEDAAFRTEYVSVRDADTLEIAGPDTHHIVILAAAWLGKARLIDNVLFSLDK